jgi:DNA polymerase-3 subunit chi
LTRVDFYFNVADQLNFSCRLVRKVIHASKANQEEPIVVYCPKKSKLSFFSELLYSFSSVDFLPHVVVGDSLEVVTPIILSSIPWLPITPRRPNLLLNLDNKICEVFGSFDRVLEVVGNEEHEKLSAREKFVFYKNRGYQIHNHDVSEK